MAIELKKLLKRSSVAKNMGSSITIVSVCFRILKQYFGSANLSMHLGDFNESNGYIRHNILFLKDIPREVNIALYKEKQQILTEINKELTMYDFRYTLKDILVK